jgi:hypothetical protein
LPPARLDLLGHGFGAAEDIVVDHDAAAALGVGQLQGDLAADALSGAGHEGDAAAQVEDIGHVVSLPYFVAISSGAVG